MVGLGFEHIDSVYWDVFGYSFFEVFLDKEPRGSKIKWKLKRLINYFATFCVVPTFCTLMVLGGLYGRKAGLKQIAFECSYTAYLIHMVVKMAYFIFRKEDMRMLCTEFDSFHFARHRPVFTQFRLSKTAHLIRKVTTQFNMFIYINLAFWQLQGWVKGPGLYTLARLGLISNFPENPFPKIAPVRYPFDENKTGNAIFISVLETIHVYFSLADFVPIDMFFATTIMMICDAMDVLCLSAQDTIQLLTEEETLYSEGFGPGDENKKLDIRLFIEDHQRILGYVY